MVEKKKIEIEDFTWCFIGFGILSEAEFSLRAKDFQIEMVEKDSWVPNKLIYPYNKILIYIQGEPSTMFMIKTNKLAGFTTLELMYKLHNKLQSFDLGDHVYFEGLKFVKNSEDNTEIYELFLGN